MNLVVIVVILGLVYDCVVAGVLSSVYIVAAPSGGGELFGRRLKSFLRYRLVSFLLSIFVYEVTLLTVVIVSLIFLGAISIGSIEIYRSGVLTGSGRYLPSGISR